MQITFHGAARKVTGSKHLITTENGRNILLDCGLFQGEGAQTDELNRHLGFDPHTVNFLILSHAHADHAGNIPYLFAQGFSGTVFCTKATLDLCSVMLLDSAHIQEHDIEYVNKKRRRRGQGPLQPLYTADDVALCIKNFKAVEYDQWITAEPGIEFLYTDSGHILGSAGVSLKITETKKVSWLFFSGDIGRYSDLILREPQPFPQMEYIICESTYGNRLHEPAGDAAQRLLAVITDTCKGRGGKVIIPAFSLGRTQEIIYTLDRLNTQGKMPDVKIYIDSPLSVNVTSIMRRHPESFNPEIKEYMKGDPDPFSYNNVTFITDVEDSKALNESDEPCVIISASGMIEAGRVKHHVKNNIGNSKNTILIVGYCPPASLGGKLMNGDPVVKIFGKEYEVHAHVEVISNYSAHADYNEMLKYLSCQDASLVKKLFLVHGVPASQEAFRERLMHAGFRDVVIPYQGDTALLN
jgi:metallo-beta-lactamase family protein